MGRLRGELSSFEGGWVWVELEREGREEKEDELDSSDRARDL